MQDYKPNSHRFREEQKQLAPVEKKKVEKVVKGSVKTKKKGNLSKISDVLISEDADNVKSYILMDVLVPTVKKAIVDIVTDAVNMVFLGGTGRSKTTSSSNYISYNRLSEPRDRYHSSEPRAISRFDYENIVFTSRVDAEAIIEQMNDIISSYGFVTVADLYEMADLSHPYTSNDYGWTSIVSAAVIHVRDGWVIKLPKARPIDK